MTLEELLQVAIEGDFDRFLVFLERFLDFVLNQERLLHHKRWQRLNSQALPPRLDGRVQVAQQRPFVAFRLPDLLVVIIE